MEGYTPAMRESIKRVETSRPSRLQETWPMMTPAEKQEILSKFHPDYKREGMRELRVGPAKGLRTPHELADLLEGHSMLRGVDLDLRQIDFDTDVLIIGGGGAGSAAALLAREQDAKVLMVTKLRHGDANTMMAQGGIQAADKPADSPVIHYLDVMGGGHFANDPDLVEALVHDAPGVIAWLEGLGCMFDKESDGSMLTMHGGGTSRKRMHSARDYSGAEIMRTLRDEVRSYPEDIIVIEFAPAIELLMDDKGQCAGAVLLNLETDEHYVVRAKTTIMATGGSGRLHYQGFATTNHYGATGDGVILAYRVGADLSFLDTMQYHPTGAAYPAQIVGLLVTEKVRGLGAQVCNIHGNQFVFPRETRDVEASAIIRECVERNTGIETPSGFLGVWLESDCLITTGWDINNNCLINLGEFALLASFWLVDLTSIPPTEVDRYALVSCRTSLNDGSVSEADTNKTESNKLSVRSDNKAAKSWIKFDISDLDISFATAATLRITLYEPKTSTCLLSAVNDDCTDNISWGETTLTWNNAPGNITSGANA